MIFLISQMISPLPQKIVVNGEDEHCYKQRGPEKTSTFSQKRAAVVSESSTYI